MKLTGIDKRPVLPRLLVADALDREFKEIAGRRTA